MGANIGEQVVDDPPKRGAISDHLDRLGGAKDERPLGTDGAGRLDRLVHKADELDWLGRCGRALVELGEREEVLDELSHARRLGLDPREHPRKVLLVARRASPEQLGVGRDGRNRRSELVRRVGDEASEALVGCLQV